MRPCPRDGTCVGVGLRDSMKESRDSLSSRALYGDSLWRMKHDNSLGSTPAALHSAARVIPRDASQDSISSMLTPADTCIADGSGIYRHRRQHVCCVGTDVLVLKMTASVRAFQRYVAHANRVYTHRLYVCACAIAHDACQDSTCLMLTSANTWRVPSSSLSASLLPPADLQAPSLSLSFSMPLPPACRLDSCQASVLTGNSASRTCTFLGAPLTSGTPDRPS